MISDESLNTAYDAISDMAEQDPVETVRWLLRSAIGIIKEHAPEDISKRWMDKIYFEASEITDEWSDRLP